MCRHFAKLLCEQLRASRIRHLLQKLKQINKNIQPDQKPINIRRAVPRLIVSDREHRSLIDLVS